jgi:hypothetical protein
VHRTYNTPWGSCIHQSCGSKDADDDDEEEEWVVEWNRLDVIPDEEAVDEEINFEPGDTLGKALALINQVSLALRD